MTSPLSSNAAVRSEDAEIAQASLALLAELERSLLAGQQALLSRDVVRVEQATHDQIRGQRALAILWSREAAGPEASDPGAPATAPPYRLPNCDVAVAAALRSAQMRVLALGRVQAALVSRAQRWGRTVSNLLAGPEASYVPPAWPPASRIASQEKEQEGDSCRA